MSTRVAALFVFLAFSAVAMVDTDPPQSITIAERLNEQNKQALRNWLQQMIERGITLFPGKGPAPS